MTNPSTQTAIQEAVQRCKGKISDHLFDGSCCYNDNEGGKGHKECRYPYNPGRKDPKGKQCLKLKEEHFDLSAELFRIVAIRDEQIIGALEGIKIKGNIGTRGTIHNAALSQAQEIIRNKR